ncbi:hypothetical protein D770_04950 [Flammeovirgaceae bacterium 311]|nr:hypothetical protein D770_04950 [Flammeovirgaceae bacterium 311]
MKPLKVFIIFILYSCNLFSQCIEQEKIGLGGEFGSIPHTFRCPTYNFSFKGVESKEWNIVDDPIHITQAGDEVLLIKEQLEKKIMDYSGEDFFSKLTFHSVEVSYPDSVEKFKTRMPKVDLEKCTAKYFFYYYFVPEDFMKYCIGFALDTDGNILSNFNFPSKNEYREIDKSLNKCEVLDIARATNKEIDPIDKISFEYDDEKKIFYWLIKQKIVNPKEGVNEYNVVVVNAADRTEILSFKRTGFIQF